MADYTSKKLNWEDPATYRDLSKPIGALNEERLAYLKCVAHSLSVVFVCLFSHMRQSPGTPTRGPILHPPQ